MQQINKYLIRLLNINRLQNYKQIGHMKEVIISILLIAIAYAHIYSSPPETFYDYNGNPKYYSIYFALENGLGASDYLRLIWPDQIFNTNKNQILAYLIDYSNNVQVANSTFANQNLGATLILHVTFGYELTANSWYQVQIYPTKNPTGTPKSSLVQLLAVSSFATNFIIYDSNYAFGFIDIFAPLSSTNTLSIVCNTSSPQNNTAAAIYNFDIYITPTIASSTGANFTLTIYYNSAQPLHAGGTTLKDFSFIGFCQSSATVSDPAANLTSCIISSDSTTLTFSVSSLVANKVIRISTSISNPSYYSVRGINGYWVEPISGRIYQNGFMNNALKVNKIDILTIQPRIQLFWGIDHTYNDSSLWTTPAPLFKAQNANPNILKYNSFNIGFSFPSSSPINGLYIVQIILSAQGFLEGSIAHNFPAYSQSTVYCYYSSTKIICNNVGAFMNINYRYWISGKACFNSLTANTISFGSVTIIPVVYSNTGTLVSNTFLYNSLPGETITVKTTRQLLDLSGYHNTATYSIGNAQVISYNDDLSLSSTANGIKGILQGTNTTVGVVPDLGTSQQLIFLLKTLSTEISSGGNPATDFTIKVMFNNKVIGFQSDAVGRGLDFVGYSSAATSWTITTSPCYLTTIVCQKYSNNTPITNKKTIINSDSTSNYYGVYQFQCGSTFMTPTSCASNCATQCNMFTGLGFSNAGSSIMSMRQVLFPQGYHAPIYVDNYLLDFLFIFYQGGIIQSYCLINGYTVSGKKLQNIKAAYVNYYDNSVGLNYNKGHISPMMLRIGGGVLSTESLDSTVIGVFFDDYVDASTFYSNSGSSYSVGCSTNNCLYYPNAGLSNIRTDNWLTNRMVIIDNIPPIQNQFNILVPVTPSTTVTTRNPPKVMTIAFFTKDYAIADVTGLLKTKAVYRLFGTTVTGSVLGAIPNINGLVRNTTTPTLDMAASSFASSITFNPALDIANMYANPTNNTFLANTNSDSTGFGTAFGAGYTITSLFYNIFEQSTLSWQTPPANTATTCTVFGYTYNQIQAPGTNAHRHKQNVYLTFCPIDSALSISTPAANINFLNPNYPLIYTTGYNFKLITIAYSTQFGLLRGYRKQDTAGSPLIRTCTTAKLNNYNPSTSGTTARQRATFTFSFPAITLSSVSKYNGYSEFRIQISAPTSTISVSTLTFGIIGPCSVSIPTLSCSIASSTNPYQFSLTYTGTEQLTINYLQLSIFGNSNGTFGPAANYVATINLYQQTGSENVPFGTSSTNQYTYCTCQSSFIVGITPYEKLMNLNSVQFSSQKIGLRSPIKWNFGPLSYREAFFTTSTYVFNLGYLTNPNSNTYLSRNNFRCHVYQGLSLSSLKLSSSFSTFALTFSAATLVPKSQIVNPSSLIYQIKCLGGAVPNGNTSAISLNWMDSAIIVQQATDLAYNSGSFITTAFPNTVTIAIQSKRFRTIGAKSLYSLTVTSNIALDSKSIYYFDFHMILSSNLDNEGGVECYIRTSSTINDILAKQTYCSFTNPWQLMVWNNQLSIAANTPIYIDIYNIDQPKAADISAGQYISVAIDNDNNYANGALSYNEIIDTASIATAVGNIHILTSAVTSNFILSLQDLQMTINTQVTNIFTTPNTNFLYLLFPASYSVWIKRGQSVLTTFTTGMTSLYCELTVSGSATNLASTCNFISQRMLKITVNAITNNLFTLRLKNIQTPAAVPLGKFNQYKFKLFVSNTAESETLYYSYTDFSQELSLTTNPNLIYFNWNYYSLSVSDSLFTLSRLSNTIITLQIGYYSNIIQLRQSIYPNNFKTTITLALTNIDVDSTHFSFLTNAISGSLVSYLGYSTAYFKMAGKPAVSPGKYILYFSKSGDTNNLYTNIPPLTIVVQNNLCSLVTNALAYTLPVGGSTLPIIINGINCIPIDSITIDISFTGTGNNQFLVDSLSSRTLQSTTKDSQLYIIIKHTAGTLISGNSITVVFTISGPNSAYYATIPNIILTLIDPTTFLAFPTATPLSAPTLSANTAIINMQCSQASTIYWGLGVYPSILTYSQEDFKLRLTSQNNGLVTNFTETNDYFTKSYGIKQGSAMEIVPRKIYNLQSGTTYLFKYYCVNQLGHLSDGQTINFTSLNYGAYLMKVEVSLRGNLTYQQINDLSCSMASNFNIPLSRIITQAMSTCNQMPLVLYPSASTVIGNRYNSDGQYIYAFYIQPDTSNPTDTTNNDIRNSLTINTFTTTIITSTSNYISLPSLVQMLAYDIQIYTEPVMNITSAAKSGIYSIEISAQITNMNGFIVMGVYQGIYDAQNMTLPITTDIKQGKFNINETLVSTKMIHASQNVAKKLTFSSLNSNTDYVIFYFCTIENPHLVSLSSKVNYIQVKTLQLLTIDANWQSYLTIISILLFLLLI